MFWRCTGDNPITWRLGWIDEPFATIIRLKNGKWVWNSKFSMVGGVESSRKDAMAAATSNVLKEIDND